MQPVEGPTKICPECHSSVFESETVCGFCGHVFAEEHAAVAQPSTVTTKVCPVCKAPVPSADAKCGICGHVFSAEAIAKAQSWPQTYRYAKWGAKGLYTGLSLACACFGLVIALPIYAACTVSSLRVGALSIASALLFVFVALATLTFMQAMKSSVTVYGDRIEWTTTNGKRFTIRNAELTFGNAFVVKNGRGYKFGAEDGRSLSVTDSLDGFDDVVAEIESRLGR